MKSILPAIAIATGGLLGLASLGANAADGTITITGTVTNNTCSINGVAAGSPADLNVPMNEVTASSLTTAGATGGTTATPVDINLTKCTGGATKAVAHFENGPTVDQNTGNLTNSGGTAKNVQVQLLNAKRLPINIVTSANNDIATDSTDISSGSGKVQYYSQYYSTGAAEAGSVNTSVQYTMQYQ
ncbi:fimbrial protein [Paraburkholderia nemoris]|jgi:major type 1 subunit fimbrin (pilin)|uniref:Major fimbrial subunit SMF-1 n=1 Tax=Paraburkholderia nemoris TaxID=2793076 RepID=A0ABN7KXA1_9BURK|nr:MULTISPECIES: fimbrial protein [Paraburkholderia]KPD19281.1 fimbrial protein [Burkholderia sp. ST111]MBK5147197.1 fimbrial protein [Burkholderia sp. R-69608]MBK3738595.1 fimbrial protein [Paraburkholderia aspalathi]MBK3809488.1 fimbrial protein [Paraburkholderia aspalathi]CAE6715292.1 Major fimbrial subunit SMF-1 [Paraburkholderia nemoris]